MENIKNENVWPLLEHAENIGRSVGFADLTGMHGEWIQEMVFGEEDYTLQAHRGSFKSSCLAVAIALLMVLYPKWNIIFLRKTDSNVAEMMTMVSKILGSQVMKGICSRVHRKKPLKIVSESLDHISTNLWHSPIACGQGAGGDHRGGGADDVLAALLRRQRRQGFLLQGDPAAGALREDLYGAPEQGDQDFELSAEMVAEHCFRAGDGSGVY